MPRVRNEGDRERSEDSTRRLPLRWAVILAIAAGAAVPAAAGAGLAAGIAAFIGVAVALHSMVA